MLDLLAKVDVNTSIINELFRGTNNDEETLTEFMARRIGELESKRDAGAYEKHQLWMELREDIWKVHHPHEPLPEFANDELYVARQVNLTCPLSQAPLDDPVKNPVCGHNYSRDAAEQYMKRQRLRGVSPMCPVVGCSSAMANLERDYEAIRALQKSGKNKKRARPGGKLEIE